MSGDLLRALIVDDERPARERLRRLLAGIEGVEVVGEAEDGGDAIEKIGELRPGLIFLDIQMPGCSGLELAASLPAPRPRIVFCTAFDQHAVDAFELHAVDYLLKPVSLARLEKAVERARGVTDPDRESAPDLAGRAAGLFPLRFLGKRGSSYHVIPAEEVICFASEGGLTKLLTAEHHYWMQPSLTDLEARLDPGRYYRVSRSAIVSLDRVREVKPEPGGSGAVTLADGSRIEVSRRRLAGLMERLAGE